MKSDASKSGDKVIIFFSGQYGYHFTQEDHGKIANTNLFQKIEPFGTKGFKLKSDASKSGENVIIFFLGNMGIILPRRSKGT